MSIDRPLRVWGAEVSYYTGKLEAYLRYKEIPYTFETQGAKAMRAARQKTGAAQMPMVELPDGRWLADTTPMIECFERRYTEAPVLPKDPLVAFVTRLVEDTRTSGCGGRRCTTGGATRPTGAPVPAHRR